MWSRRRGLPSLTGGEHAEGLGHAGPRRSQRDERLDVAVLPGLRLLVEEVQGVHVAHAVSYENHGPAGLVCHLLDQLLQRQEIFLILICKRKNEEFNFPSLPLIASDTLCIDFKKEQEISIGSMLRSSNS